MGNSTTPNNNPQIQQPNIDQLINPKYDTSQTFKILIQTMSNHSIEQYGIINQSNPTIMNISINPDTMNLPINPDTMNRRLRLTSTNPDTMNPSTNPIIMNPSTNPITTTPSTNPITTTPSTNPITTPPSTNPTIIIDTPDIIYCPANQPSHATETKPNPDPQTPINEPKQEIIPDPIDFDKLYRIMKINTIQQKFNYSFRYFRYDMAPYYMDYIKDIENETITLIKHNPEQSKLINKKYIFDKLMFKIINDDIPMHLASFFTFNLITYFAFVSSYGLPGSLLCGTIIFACDALFLLNKHRQMINDILDEYHD